MKAAEPLRPGGLASLEDLDDLTVAVAAIVDVEARLRARVANEAPERTVLMRAQLSRLASAIAAQLGTPGLFVVRDDELELESVHAELAAALVARAFELGRIQTDPGPSGTEKPS